MECKCVCAKAHMVLQLSNQGLKLGDFTCMWNEVGKIFAPKMKPGQEAGKAKMKVEFVNGTHKVLTFANSVERDRMTEYILGEQKRAAEAGPSKRRRLEDSEFYSTSIDILSRDPVLQTQYNELVPGILTHAEFWEQRGAILDEAQWRASKQKTGMTSEFTARVQNDEDARVQNITYKLNVERIQAIFLHYPEVKQAYADYVPDKMTEEQFWSQYFRSAWFYRDRGLSAGADRDIGAGVTDMFSAYETEATARLPGDDGSRHLERRVNPLVDLTATEGDAQRTRGIAHVEQLQRAAALASTKAMAAAAHAARGRTSSGGGGTAGAAATSGAAAASSKGEMVIAAYNRHSFLRVEGTADAESRMAAAAAAATARPKAVASAPQIPGLRKDTWTRPAAPGSAANAALRDAIAIPELKARQDPSAACVELQLTQPPALGGGPRESGPRTMAQGVGGGGGGWSTVSHGAGGVGGGGGGGWSNVSPGVSLQQGSGNTASEGPRAGISGSALQPETGLPAPKDAKDATAVGGQQASGAQLLRPLQLRAAFAPPDAALEILLETTALARAQAQELGDGAPGRTRGSIAAETMVRIEAIFQSVVELLRHYWARAVHMDRSSVVAAGQQRAAQEQAAKLKGILGKLKEKDAEANTLRLHLLGLQPPRHAEAAMLSPLLAQIRAAIAHDEQ